MDHSLSRIALIVVALTSACATQSNDAPAAPSSAAAKPAAKLAMPMHVEDDPGIRFPLPDGVTTQTYHYDKTLPPVKFRHAIHLETTHGISVLIHVWDNPEKLEIHAWLAQNFEGIIGPATSLKDRVMSKAKVPGILLEEPASEQALSQAIGFFAEGTHVFSITGMNPTDDATAKALFEREIDEFEPEVAR